MTTKYIVNITTRTGDYESHNSVVVMAKDEESAMIQAIKDNSYDPDELDWDEYESYNIVYESDGQNGYRIEGCDTIPDSDVAVLQKHNII